MSIQTQTSTLDPARLKRQQEIVQKWDAQGRRGTLEATTGFGKTTTAQLAADHLKTLHPHVYNAGIMVVVPTQLLADQWTERLRAWGQEAVVELIQTVSKQAPNTYACGLLILDEIHHYAAPVFRRVFDVVRYNSLFGLTATLPEEDERRVLLTEKAPVVDSVTLQECLEEGWVSPFQIYNLPVVMSEDEDDFYTELNKQYHKDFALFNHDFHQAMRCVGSQDERNAWARTTRRDVRLINAAAFRWIKNTQQRKQMLCNLPSKHQAALEIIQRFPERLIVTFSQTIESAERMADMVGNGALAYHSKIKGGSFRGERLSAAEMRKKTLERFASQHHWSRTNVLCTAIAFDVGADIPHIDMGIVLSGSSKSLQALQRYGRTLRKLDGKRTIIVELYAVRRNGAGSTQDLTWLRKRQKAIAEQVSWIQDRSQIV